MDSNNISDYLQSIFLKGKFVNTCNDRMILSLKTKKKIYEFSEVFLVRNQQTCYSCGRSPINYITMKIQERIPYDAMNSNTLCIERVMGVFDDEYYDDGYLCNICTNHVKLFTHFNAYEYKWAKKMCHFDTRIVVANISQFGNLCKLSTIKSTIFTKAVLLRELIPIIDLRKYVLNMYVENIDYNKMYLAERSSYMKSI